MLAFLTLTLLGGVLTVPPTENVLLTRVVNAVKHTLDFFAEDYSAINVDGLFGLRLGQGQLKSAVRECERRACDSRLLARLRELEALLNTAADAALPYLKDEDPQYYNRFHATIDQPYVLPYEPRTFSKVGDGQENSLSYDEERGDACYARLMGTYEEGGRTLAKCNTTSDCWDYMTREGTGGYFLTHQLLFFIFIEHMECREAVEGSDRSGQVRAAQQTMCARIFHESRQLAAPGDVNSFRKDLFLEQTVLCGPLGFEDFYRPDWIQMVLGWPDKRLGCFRRPSFSSALQDLLKTTKRARAQIFPEEDDYETVADGSMRKLLREKQMKEGCLSHTSGLGFGVLCSYLRFMVRDLYATVQ
ncbi:UPF0764 protein C16orf89 homolog [Mya arenaria]|nr:UPF0764 protein C16orf89 homolog [Mya arenaria]